MDYLDINRARICAEQEIETADEAVRGAVRLIIGRLKVARVAPWMLKDLKRELRDFNMQTSCWKD